MKRRRLTTVLGSVLVVAGCASGPTPPDWQADALQALQDAQAAYLKGDTAGEARQFERARGEIARTGQLALMARAELMRCAAHAASLVITVPAGAIVLARIGWRRDRSPSPAGA